MCASHLSTLLVRIHTYLQTDTGVQLYIFITIGIQQTAFIHSTKLQVAVATNPTHYGNPSSGCESDEQAVKVQGLSGDFCSPKCDSTGSCPSDVPKGDTATPECALRTTTGDKYCALICQSDSDCGS